MAEGAGAVALAALLQRQDGGIVGKKKKTLPCSYRAGIWM